MHELLRVHDLHQLRWGMPHSCLHAITGVRAGLLQQVLSVCTRHSSGRPDDAGACSGSGLRLGHTSLLVSYPGRCSLPCAPIKADLIA